VDEASARYVDAVGDAVHEILGSRTLGVYLHGSAVLGGYDVRRSDIDVLVVSDGPLDVDEQGAVARSLSEERLPCPAGGLELSVVTQESARLQAAKPLFELHVTTAPADSKVVDGHDRAGDPDLVLHFAVCRSAGQLLGLGMPREEAFAPVPRELVLTQLADEMAWGAANAATEYAVLNACRAWKCSVDGTLVSKVDGGDWVLTRPVDADVEELVRRALVRQRVEGSPALDHLTLHRFVDEVRERLNSSVG
jgi:hypothetical protein